jgi:hypothetical protein
MNLYIDFSEYKCIHHIPSNFDKVNLFFIFLNSKGYTNGDKFETVKCNVKYFIDEYENAMKSDKELIWNNLTFQSFTGNVARVLENIDKFILFFEGLGFSDTYVDKTMKYWECGLHKILNESKCILGHIGDFKFCPFHAVNVYIDNMKELRNKLQHLDKNLFIKIM